MLYYITGNKNKIAVAQKFLSKENISFEPKCIDMIEVQSHSIEDIALSKAKQAFNRIHSPLFVNDHGWNIHALNGFPGAYMKYMNEWLSPEDFLHLMKDKADRSVTLTEVICYIDKDQHKIFTQKHPGTLLQEIQGKGLPFPTITSLSTDGVSVAKKLETSPNAIPDNNYTIWKEFAQWYKAL